MKKRKIWRILIIVFIIITIARESGIVNLNIYQTKSSCNSFIMVNTSSTASNWQEYEEEEKPQHPPVKVIIIYDGQEYGDVEINNSDSSNQPVRIDVSDVDLSGFLWTPLYKHTSFEYKKRVSRQTIVSKNGENKNSTIPIDVEIEGTFSMIGFCSYRSAKIIVINTVMSEVYRLVKSKM